MMNNASMIIGIEIMIQTETDITIAKSTALAVCLKDMLLALAHQATRVEQLARQAYMHRLKP